VERSASISTQAVSQSENANHKIVNLVEAANKIGEVLTFITSIAEQINLLALNATVEAARAGDAGKGFAVVASEVKNLANQTSQATEEISQQIQAIQEETYASADALKTIGTTIDQMSEISASIAASVEEQDMATQEITRSIQEAAIRTDDVSETISHVLETTLRAQDSANHVQQSATKMSQEMAHLQTKVTDFIDHLNR